MAEKVVRVKKLGIKKAIQVNRYTKAISKIMAIERAVAPEEQKKRINSEVGSYETEEEYRKPRLQLAEACAKLGISYYDFFSMYLSFSDPYSEESMKIVVREKDPNKIKKAFEELKSALQLGIGEYNRETNAKFPDAKTDVKLDRLTLTKVGFYHVIDFGYSNVERKQKILR